MFGALKKLLHIRTTNHAEKCTEIPLFSGSAYFSSRVPKAFLEKWMAHGGEVSSGMALDTRARYFFAIDPSELWVTKLFSKSVMVIHAGWIMHCVDQAFQVPISEYILDGKFVPQPPYKSTSGTAPSESGGPIDSEPGAGSTPVQTSDTPSTPTSIPRKRKREQAYFDSPSGSLVFSEFDKDGIPRRPRKQRKLRFDPSFSPGSGRSGRGVVQGTGSDCFGDYHCASTEDDEIGDGHERDEIIVSLSGRLTTSHSSGTPDKPFVDRGSPARYPHSSADEHLSNSPVISGDKDISPVRTIDFTSLPPSTGRFRFPVAKGTKAGDQGAVLSIVKSTDDQARRPKKISFTNHARVCIYTTSPRRADTVRGVGARLTQHPSDRGSEDGPGLDGNTLTSSNNVKVDSFTAEATQHTGPKINDDSPRLDNGNRSKNTTLTLTMEEVQQIRGHLLTSAENHVSDGQLATLFQPGKTYRGVVFHHVW